MTKDDLAKEISKKSGMPFRASRKVLVAVLSEMTKALSNGDNIIIRKFGELRTCHKRERMGRNPRTGEDRLITARRVVQFKPSKQLKAKVNH